MKRKQRILLVEDENMIALVEQRMLTSHGFEVVRASSGEQAVEMAAADECFDLVLMDIDLGEGIDGTAAAGRILSSRDIPLIFLSSHTEREIVKKTEGITSYGYIVKNTGETVLIASIKMAFRLAEARARERVQDAARQRAAEELERYFSSSLDLLCILDTDGRVLRANPEWSRTLGYELTEFEGSALLLYVHPKERQSTLALLEELKRGAEVAGFENRMRDSDGRFRWIEWRARREDHEIYAAATEVTERRQAKQRERALVKEQRLLLLETQRQIRNNMSVIQGLIMLEADRQADPKSKRVLLAAAGRLHSMMVLNQKLYEKGSYREIALQEFAPTLVQDVINTYSSTGTTQLTTDFGDVILPAHVLAPVSIILNELSTNSIKHAFPDPKLRRNLCIRISASQTGSTVQLIYEDNGVGLGATQRSEPAAGSGMQIVAMLTAQIGGTLELGDPHSTRIVVSFPV